MEIFVSIDNTEGSWTNLFCKHSVTGISGIVTGSGIVLDLNGVCLLYYVLASLTLFMLIVVKS